MPFDPFRLDETHEKVREAIQARKIGFAQSDVGGVLVSYVRHEFPGGLYHAPMVPQKRANEILEDMMIDVARGEGIASDRTFDLAQLEWAIKDRKKYPTHWVKKHKEAELLLALQEERPDLFV